MTASVARLDCIGRTVTDLPRASAFYRDALGFTVETEADPVWVAMPGAGISVRALRLTLGRQAVELAAFDPPGAPYPADSTAADLWFQHIAIVTPDMGAAYRRLMAHGAVTITEGGPQRLPPSTGRVTAFKFRDPDLHPLELIQFPAGTGDPAWQQGPPGALTLGIDHSALSIADPARSIGFYAGALGLVLASQQVNTGPEQERLDGLGGVAVDVIALRPTQASTPHVELLGYRTPRGRPPHAARPNDVACDRTIMRVRDVPAALAAMSASDIVSRAPDDRTALLRDPDGHMVVLKAD